MKKLFFITGIFQVISLAGYAQGCIPVRSINGIGQYNLTNNAFSTANWQLNFSNRYFQSARDFREKVDQKTPVQNKILNETYTIDLSVTRLLAKGWSVNMSIPVTANSRTTSFEHGGANTPRRATRSFGAGDLRLTAYKWMRKPAAAQKWNAQLGIGIKFATGDYNFQDYFYRNDSTKVLSPVNPGIQLGDGGTGIITELNTFYTINESIGLYANFYYLISPREQNGTVYTFGRTPNPLVVKAGGVENSVPDVYSIRAGGYAKVHRFTFEAGIRNEGTPVEDLVGGSNGGRRAGHVLSVEPGVIYNLKSASIYVYAPITIDRRIKQNIPDKIMSQLTGVKTVGAGGSPDYQLIAGISFQL